MAEQSIRLLAGGDQGVQVMSTNTPAAENAKDPPAQHAGQGPPYDRGAAAGPSSGAAPGTPLLPNLAGNSATSRPLWQAPLFVLGVAALVGMGVARPFAQETAIRRFDRDLIHVRKVLAQPNGDIEDALAVAENALQTATDQFPERLVEVNFLLGTVHMRLAEKSPPSRAAEEWRRAHDCLESANSEKEALAEEEDRTRLNYRLGKVGFHTDEDLKEVIERLEESTPHGDNRAEGYALLTQAYLRLSPPDYQKAFACNRKRRESPDVSDQDLLAATLQGGELLLNNLDDPREARKLVEKISAQAPPDILMRARLLRARAYQKEKQWNDAVRLFRIALSDATGQVPEPASVYFDLGLCYRQLDNAPEAEKAWEKCVELAKGSEGPAAALVLAELYLLNAKTYDRALEYLVKSVAASKPGAWNNPLIDANRTIGTFEHASQLFREDGKHELAWRLLDSFARVAPPSKVLPLRGAVAFDWAKALRNAARDIARLADEEKKAVELFGKSGDAYGEAAALPGLKPAEQGQFLSLSSVSYREAGDPVKSAEKLEKLVKLDVGPNELGKAWYQLGEVHRQCKDAEAAEAAYRKCMAYDTRFAYLARYQVAMAALAAGNIDEAQAALVYNVKMLRFEADADALLQSQLALGNLLYQHGDYRGAYRPLEDALGRFKETPQAPRPEVTQARFQLADCYRQLALAVLKDYLAGGPSSPEWQEERLKEQRRWMEQAAEEFNLLNDYLETTPEAKDHLSKSQRTQVPFITAKCWFNLGKYDRSLAIYKKLKDRYPEQVEGLDALGGAVTCHAAMGQIDQVKSCLLQIEKLLPKMPEDIRRAWEEWLEKALQPLKDL
jgi:tetratricopeptide (TPR) repeat protein